MCPIFLWVHIFDEVCFQCDLIAAPLSPLYEVSRCRARARASVCSVLSKTNVLFVLSTPCVPLCSTPVLCRFFPTAILLCILLETQNAQYTTCRLDLPLCRQPVLLVSFLKVRSGDLTIWVLLTSAASYHPHPSTQFARAYLETNWSAAVVCDVHPLPKQTTDDSWVSHSTVVSLSNLYGFCTTC